MSLINSGFDGTVTERDFSRIMRGVGVRDSVETVAAWNVTQGTGRQVSVAPGVAYAAGVVSDSGVAILAALPTPTNGQWHLVVRRITWANNTVTVATIPHTTTTTAIPTAPPAGFPVFNDNTGVLVDQLLAWAWVRSTDTTVAVFDLRQTPISSGFLVRETLYLAASTTFLKANYPWLRAMRVKVVAGGGAGGGATATGAGGASKGGGGGGGGYAETFITDIAGLAASVTVTVGAGGASVSGGAGLNGGNSSFGALAVAGGGLGGGIPSGGSTSFPLVAAGGFGGSATTGQLLIPGGQGGFAFSQTVENLRGAAGAGGATPLGFGGYAENVTSLGNAPAGGFGGGGAGAYNHENNTARTGGFGRVGVVIVELFS